jgi:hypothetical protein
MAPNTSSTLQVRLQWMPNHLNHEPPNLRSLQGRPCMARLLGLTRPITPPPQALSQALSLHQFLLVLNLFIRPPHHPCTLQPPGAPSCLISPQGIPSQAMLYHSL